MAHYFDDILHRHQRQMSSPKVNGGPQFLRRRSSAGRSIGARSDFGLDLDEDDVRSVTATSVAPHDEDDPEATRKRDEANEHMHKYIADQLERFKDEKSEVSVNETDELEANA